MKNKKKSQGRMRALCPPRRKLLPEMWPRLLPSASDGTAMALLLSRPARRYLWTFGMYLGSLSGVRRICAAQHHVHLHCSQDRGLQLSTC